MIFITETDQVDFSAEGFRAESYEFDASPARRSSRASVIGGLREIVFYEGYSNKQLKVRFINATHNNRVTRQENLHALMGRLQTEGFLVFDSEPGWMYKGRILEPAQVSYSKFVDYVTVTFDLDPIAYSSNVSAFTTTGGNITVTNLGNHPAPPLISLTAGVATPVTISTGGASMTIQVSGTRIVDCEKMVVYDDAGGNRILDHGGGFITLAPGDNEVSVGATSEVTLEFKNKDRWV